jgi:hypothetical protein
VQAQEEVGVEERSWEWEGEEEEGYREPSISACQQKEDLPSS